MGKEHEDTNSRIALNYINNIMCEAKEGRMDVVKAFTEITCHCNEAMGKMMDMDGVNWREDLYNYADNKTR